MQTLRPQDENEYFALRAKGLDHDAAMRALGAVEDTVDRSEWAPEQVADPPDEFGGPGHDTRHEDQCEGHYPGPYDPTGSTVFCDGSCRA